MKNKLLLLFTFLTLGLLKVNAQVPAYEKAALIALYNSTNGANWTNNTNWNTAQPVSTWFGVTVTNLNGVDHVTSINMNGNNLMGTLPTQIGDFPELTTLFLYNHAGLTGAIPSQITFLSKLISIAFFNNNMSGVIPAGMSNIQSLKGIYFAGNNFTGAVPDFTTPVKYDLWLAQNRFEFGDFENEFSTYQSFGSSFTYFQQNQFYEDVVIEKTIGDAFTVSTTVSGTNNNYQWYKVNSTFWDANIANATAITGATNSTLTLTNAQNNDFGYYYCVVTSNIVPNLEIKKERIRVVQTIPTIERDALIALYNATDGPNWTNNTNWNTAQPVATWAGVTIDNGHVSVISKGGQNLTGVLPNELLNLTYLKTFFVHSNNLSGTIPDLTSITTLENLAFRNNNYHFADFENEFTAYTNLNNLYYNPQNKVDVDIAIDIVVGDNYTLTMPTINGTGITYQWYKNDVAILGATNLTYTITNAQLTDAGDYTCKASSTIVTGLTIDRKTIHLYGTIDAADRNALIVLYYATAGANWTNSTNWNTTAPVYDWYGVTVQGTRVTSINLYNNNLVGTLPTQIGDLTNVKNITISNNQISGSIPVEIGNLTALQSLYLSNNQISGSIPVEIGNLTQMQTLALQDNQLTGNLPVEIGNLTALQYLYLWTNQLNGTIPPQVGNCTNLINLSLEYNQLTGTIPAELGNLVNLKYLWLLNNQLTGNVPAIFNTMPELNTLSLYNNQLTGDLDFSANNKLRDIFLGNNLFSKIDLRNGANTNIQSFWGTNNPNLTCVLVDDVAYSNTNWSNRIDATATYVADDSACNTILGVEDNYSTENLNIYPNPTTGILNIKIPNDVAVNEIVVYNPLGQKVNTIFNNNKINLTSLNAGIYFITINTNKGSISKRIIKK